MSESRSVPVAAPPPASGAHRPPRVEDGAAARQAADARRGSSRAAWLAGATVFLVALVVRIAYVHEHHAVLGLDVSKLPQTDNHVFAEWARRIADGDVLCRQQPHAYHLWTRDVAPEGRWLEWYGGEQTYHQSPLYAYFVAGIYALLGREHATVGYVQAVFGALTCLLTFVLTRRTVSLRAGLVAGLLLALYGGFVFYDAFILRDGLMAFFTVVLALALERAAGRGARRDWLVAGAALGLFTLAKETGPALLVLTLAAAAWAWRRQPRRLVLPAALLVLGWLAVCSPALLRNVEVGAPPLRLSTRGPEVFVAGNARGQEGVSWDPPTAVMREVLMESNFSLPRAMALTLATHRADPLGYLGLLGRKTAAFFNGYEIPNNVNFDLHRTHLVSLRAAFVSMTFLGPAALLGLLLAIPRRRQLMVPAALLVTLSASVIALYVIARFRLQVAPLFALFAALSVDWALLRWSERRWGALLAAAIPFALLVAWCWGEGSKWGDLNRNFAVTKIHLKVGDFDQAMRYWRLHEQALARRGEEWTSDDANLAVRLGYIDQAFEHFETAAALPEGSPERHLALGAGYTELLWVTDRAELVEFTDLARQQFRRALEIDPRVRGAHYGLGRVAGLLGDTPRAMAHFRDELALHPDDGPTLTAAGLLRFGWGEGSYLPALQYFERALAAGAGDARVLACAARIGVDSSVIGQEVRMPDGVPIAAYDPQLALVRARRALQLAPDDPLVLEHVSTVLYVNRHFDEAIALLTRLHERLRVEQPWRLAELGARIAAFERIRDNPPPPRETIGDADLGEALPAPDGAPALTPLDGVAPAEPLPGSAPLPDPVPDQDAPGALDPPGAPDAPRSPGSHDAHDAPGTHDAPDEPAQHERHVPVTDEPGALDGGA